LQSVIDGDKPDNHDDDPDDTPPPRGGRPALRVVK
jgi:stringent starvation protein B